MTDWLDCSMAEIAAALRAGEADPEAIAEAVIDRHTRHDDVLHAYKTWDADKIRAQAAAVKHAFAAGYDLGPMQGLPVSVKDLYGVPGWPTFAGTPRQLPPKWEADGPVVASLRRQLAIVTGKTHTVEFAIGTLGTNPHWGTPRNPWDARGHRVPGGSSAGAGVSLWEGSALLALGTDTAGSVRAPASYTGTVGLKTSAGRWSTAGIVPLSSILDTVGTLARSVADTVFAFRVIDPPTHGDPTPFDRLLADVDIGTLRLGICDQALWADCSPGVAETVMATIDELVHTGAHATEATVPQVPELLEMQRTGSFAATEFMTFLARELPGWRATIDPAVTARFEQMQQMTAADYVARLKRRDQLIAAATANFDGVDVLVCPTVANTPPRLADIEQLERHQAETLLSLRNTSIANLLQYCAISIPVGLDAAGMPVGLQLMAPYNADQRLLAAATAIEKVIGTPRQRLGDPPLVVENQRLSPRRPHPDPPPQGGRESKRHV